MSNRKRCEEWILQLIALGHDVGIDYNSNGLRIVSQSGIRDISPRLRPAQMVLWLEGYRACLDNLARKKHEARWGRMKIKTGYEKNQA